jgi:cellulose synthase/poly-beta-1,6-N-acetylglucosamine synthase-like glycosyltransferase
MLEDYEITLALRHRGLKCVAPRDCLVYTDVMRSVRSLWRQRLRWQRGTLEELRRFGVSRITARDLAGQLLLMGAVFVRIVFVTAVLGTVALTGGLAINPLWVSLAGVVAFERAWSVRQLGPLASLAGLSLALEEAYGIFRECFFCRALWLTARRRPWVWHAT